jgi:UPF0716 protein FxsA
MFLKLFILFTLIPVCELYFIIRVGTAIGAFNTILIILLTASVGAYLAKTQGFMVLSRIKESMQNGQVPSYDILQGLFILIGAFALLTPGFLTDLIGISMLIPQIRATYIRVLGSYLNKLAENKRKNPNFKIYKDINF